MMPYIVKDIPYRSDTIPTFHNICGRRTVNETCKCKTCKSIRQIELKYIK